VYFAISVIDSLGLGLAAVVITELVTNDANTDFVHLPTDSLTYIIGFGVLIAALLLQGIAYQVMLWNTGGDQSAKRAAKRAHDLGLPA